MPLKPQLECTKMYQQRNLETLSKSGGWESMPCLWPDATLKNLEAIRKNKTSGHTALLLLSSLKRRANMIA